MPESDHVVRSRRRAKPLPTKLLSTCAYLAFALSVAFTFALVIWIIG